MTKIELQRYRQELMDLGKRLRGETSDGRQEVLRKTGGGASGNLSNVPTHPADLASDNYEQETAVSLLENQEQILEQAAAAMQRIDQGTFGKCQECGREISTERLRAVPYTPHCLECARRLEPAGPRYQSRGNQ